MSLTKTFWKADHSDMVAKPQDLEGTRNLLSIGASKIKNVVHLKQAPEGITSNSYDNSLTSQI